MVFAAFPVSQALIEQTRKYPVKRDAIFRTKGLRQGTIVSDIMRKIFSIEPVAPSKPAKTPISEMIQPVLTDTPEVENRAPETSAPEKIAPKAVEAKKREPVQEDVPKFVTRDVVSPLSAPPQTSKLDEPQYEPSYAGWILIGFGLAYLIGAGLYFGLPLLNAPTELFSITGLVLLLALPIVLLFLLWRALRQLKSVNRLNASFTKAADILVSPEREAYKRSESLASAIRSEISQVNQSLNETLETLKTVQTSVSEETQALDAAGLKLTSRSDDVGRNLTLQRQALESISGTFDTRMETLSVQISATSDTLDTVCDDAEAKLTNATVSIKAASELVDKSVSDGSSLLTEKITEIGEMSRKLEDTAQSLSADIENSTKQLSETDESLIGKTQAFQDLNESTQTKISKLEETLATGTELLENLKAESENRTTSVQSYYDSLSSQLKQSEDDTLAAQGKTARMVESNLAQMRRDFSRMETDLQALQSQLRNLRSTAQDAEETAYTTHKADQRLNLMPLDTDFPPVEPPRHVSTPKVEDEPLNLGMDMEIETLDDEITGFEPDVIRRPGDVGERRKSKGFGRRTEDKATGSAWRWREMLGGLESPTAAPVATSVDAVAILTGLRLSPSAIVDEGTVIDATQARMTTGEAGLVATVSGRLPDAVAHLKDKLANDLDLIKQLKGFTDGFAGLIGNTPPTAPALRAALGSPDGRAYLLCVAALKG